MISESEYIVLTIFKEQKAPQPLTFFTKDIIKNRIEENQFNEIAYSLYKNAISYIDRPDNKKWVLNKNGLEVIIKYKKEKRDKALESIKLRTDVVKNIIFLILFALSIIFNLLFLFDII